MSKPIYMSAEHLSAMNGILQQDADSKLECSKLGRDYQLTYELDNDGTTVWWTIEMNRERGVQFHLAPPIGQADTHYRGKYWAMIDATRRSRAGEAVDLPLEMTGDPGIFAVIGPALAAARKAATLDSDIPVNPA